MHTIARHLFGKVHVMIWRWISQSINSINKTTGAAYVVRMLQRWRLSSESGTTREQAHHHTQIPRIPIQSSWLSAALPCVFSSRLCAKCAVPFCFPMESCPLRMCVSSLCVCWLIDKAGSSNHRTEDGGPGSAKLLNCGDASR